MYIHSLIFAIGCCNVAPLDNININKYTSPYIVNIEQNINNSKKLVISLLSNEVYYIPLETKSSCLLKNIRKIEILDSMIFISDFRGLYKFDMNGKFIKQIGQVGKGPGEYIHVMGFCIDPYRRMINVRDFIPKIKTFDLNGNFIKETKHEFSAHQFYLLDSMNFVFKLYNIPPDNEYILYLTDLETYPLFKVKNHNIRRFSVDIAPSKTPLYFYDNTIRFKDFEVDTLISFNGRCTEAYAIFNFGKFKLDSEAFFASVQDPGYKEQFKNKLWISGIVENSEFLFIRLEKGFEEINYYALHKKQTGETIINNTGFTNDIDRGVSFWPYYVFNGNILCDFIDAYRFREQVLSNQTANLSGKYEEKYLKLLQLADAIKENDNPIVILIKTEISDP